jgi:hypothetical protein
MADSRLLLNRRPLQPGESLPSLFMRLRQANYYQSKTAVADLCRSYLQQNDDVYLPRHLHTWRILAAVTGISLSHLYLTTFHPYAPALALPSETVTTITLADGEPRPLLTNHARRTYLLPLYDAQFCPRCLATGAYHRVSWLNALTAICPQHDCLLQRGCPHCHHRLPLEAITNGHCRRCPNDLTLSPVVDVSQDTWGLWVQKTLQSWWGDTIPPALPDTITLPDQPPCVLLELLHGLARAVAHKQGGERHCRRKHPPPPQIFHHYAAAMKALVNWPQSLHQFLENHRQRAGNDAQQITVEMAPLYLSWLEKRWQAPAFTFVQEAFDDFLVAHYPLSRSLTRLRRYRQRADLRDRFPYLTEAEAAERLAVVPRVIQRLVEVGILVDYERGEEVQLHWHKRLRFIRRHEFTALQERWQAGVPLAQMTQLLDVTPDMISRLVKANLLTWQTTTNETEAVGHISLTSLSHFFNQLHPYPFTACSLAETVPLHELQAAGLDIVVILQQVMTKQLASLWFGGGLYDVQVSQKVWQLFSQA